MTMLASGSTILSMGTKTRKLRKGTLVSKETVMRSRVVLTNKINKKSMNGRIILSVNHSGKLLVDRPKLKRILH